MITLYTSVRRPLTVDEADGNISDLDGRLRAVEQLGLQATTLTAIAVDDAAGTITYTYSDGSVGALQAARVLVHPAGAWLAGTAYFVRDYVTNGGSSYIATARHTAGASFATTWPPAGGSSTRRRGRTARIGAPFATFVGTYDSTKAYVAGDMVLAQVNGSFNLYRAIGATPAGNPPGTFQPAASRSVHGPRSHPNATAEHGASIAGKPAAGATVFRRKLARSQSFFAALAGAVAALGTPPAARSS